MRMCVQVDPTPMGPVDVFCALITYRSYLGRVSKFTTKLKTMVGSRSTVTEFSKRIMV